MSRPDRAMLRSQSGPWAGCAFTAVPAVPESTVQAELFQVLLRRRLRARLPLQGRRCTAKNCKSQMDSKGDHYAACPTTGRLRRRAGPMEVALGRVLRETRARVVPNARLRELGVRAAPRQDDRNIEAAAYGLPLHHGLPMLLDITMASLLHANGTPVRGAAATDGVAIGIAEQRKWRRYPELQSSREARLVVVACETGGRWSDEAVGLVQDLAEAKARSAPEGCLRLPARPRSQRLCSDLTLGQQPAVMALPWGSTWWPRATCRSAACLLGWSRWQG